MSTPYWTDGQVSLYLGDCLSVLPSLEAGSVDSIVTDPPYGLEFMGKEWDAPWQESGINADATFSPVRMTDGALRLPRPTFTGSTNPSCLNCKGNRRGRTDGTAIRKVCTCDQPRFPNVRAIEMRAFQDWCEQWATECLRVLKPGAYMLAFGGARTWHRLACAIEDAGFEIRDSTADLTGQDAPGLMWIYGSGFPKSLNVRRAVDMKVCPLPGRHFASVLPPEPKRKPDDHVCPESPEGEAWEGWGTASKPAWEPIVVARKPLAGSVAQNVLTHGTGALNIDGCRVEATGRPLRDARMAEPSAGVYGDGLNGSRAIGTTDAGRWPPNVVLGPEAAAELDRQSGVLTSGANPERRGSDKFRDAYGEFAGQTECVAYRGADSGGASRFFPVFRYEPKASTAERPRGEDGTAHPTVKPLDLVRWKVRLVTPPGGLVLDLFAGSGTTGEACIIEGFPCVLIEKEKPSAELIRARLRKPIQPDMFGGVA